ncbi:sigma-54 interaction domain-containing protein [Pseudomonas fluorescens]|uniref:Anaerobic nitric oxide reductase transcription regulator NorR n=1 Tax=Pseudomonas fluorescens TaxID=294 RepID=A0A5E7RH58_PSEFL|nr:sigma 54-interacting transcriptional regulator [Pseudomonas fluorescens]VVN65752.1 Anaerobic nitric oxide reductase transcription regulator NorR [Pseudomonas fluorescens]VVP73304.1 Anaerobic nitric oxide reductase transcription regulator NorR [Pseudomonas fluorescens]
MEMVKADPLVAHLNELCDLYSSIFPEAMVGVAIYDDSYRLRNSAGLIMFPAVVPLSRHPVEDTPVMGECSGRALAMVRMATGAEQGAIYFAVCAAEPISEEVLVRLCKMGSGFVARTLDLLEQASVSQQLFREQKAIMDNMSDGLLVLDRFGVLRYLNAPGGRMLGVDPKKNIGREFREVIDFEPFITPIFATKKGYVDRELQIRSSRLNLHILDTAVPIIDEEGTVVSIVNTFHEIARAKRLSNRMAGDLARYHFTDIIGRSSKLTQAVAIAKRAANSDANVLLYGESGTGKEVFAQSIHNESKRAGSSFVAVNCAALPRDLIESELFGYSPGSFTGADKAGRLGRFELAAGGTIFLDEISEMPLDVQAKLLRVLQERQVTRIGGATSIALDVRVIAAANRDLTEMVAKKAFREDLFYRLNVLRIDLPSLRERPDDIELLIDQCVQRTCTLLHRSLIELGPAVIHTLRHYSWPGNVRQLQNVIERLVNMTDGDHVAEMPHGWLTDERPDMSVPLASDASESILTLAESERRTIIGALRAFDNNVTRTASALGITRPTLYKKLKQYNTDV